MEQERPLLTCEKFLSHLGIGFYQPEGRDAYNDATKFVESLVCKCLDKRNLALNTIPDVDGREIKDLAVYKLEHSNRGSEYRRIFLETVSFIDGNLGIIAALEDSLAEMRPEGEVDVFAEKRVNLFQL